MLYNLSVVIYHPDFPVISQWTSLVKSGNYFLFAVVFFPHQDPLERDLDDTAGMFFLNLQRVQKTE